MPELPEVETIRRDLEKTILGHRIVSIDIHDTRVLRQPADDFIKRLQGATIKSVQRRGKALMLELSSKEFLVVQVMMTGQMVVNGPMTKQTRMTFKLNKSTVQYNDQRIFGQLRVVNDLSMIKYFNIIGPEPFDAGFNNDYVKAYLKKTARPIKSILLDHCFVAGIGNIYASEILFGSNISPTRAGNKIKTDEIPVLLKQTRTVLEKAIKLRGSSMRNYRDGAGEKGQFNKVINVYARANDPCTTCKTPITRLVQSGRSTFYCRKCQK